MTASGQRHSDDVCDRVEKPCVSTIVVIRWIIQYDGLPDGIVPVLVQKPNLFDMLPPTSIVRPLRRIKCELR
ncbi:hypothetical protein RSO01_20310 [Reyranella soli]|uniref:Uncharacterized protein n=1 Tax=Reyranella soli TaxID=1230389 RepID=A0A512N7A8_9HYPH|nr:hypothetical protein RSO01_20310 [Reyranella soli]